MPVVAVIGAQWGDEGKGKVVDLLAARAQVVARSQGGANAGHTIQRGDQRVILHLLPSGILTPATKCLIGPGVVLDPEALLQELQEIESLGILLPGRLVIDLRAHVVFPTHKQLEICQEASLGGDKIGTTCRGIGPAYSDKTARRGVRVGDLVNATKREKACRALYDYHALMLKKLYKTKPYDLGELLERAKVWGETLTPFAGDALEHLQVAIAAKQTVLLEGAQGTFLDLDLGTYPYVTSSHPTIGGPVVGLGLAPKKIDFVLGILKAYCTRVGGGPFPTEMDTETAGLVRERGGEYGATTGRPRRIGWLDLVAARQAAVWNGIDGWAVTKLDVLDGLSPLQVCTGYRLGTKNLDWAPASQEGWEQAQPVYEAVSSWDNGRSARRLGDLPVAAQEYLTKIETFTRVPVRMISLGASQEATILPQGDLF